MIVDQPLEATIIDYDRARAQIGLELPEQVPADTFNRIRSAVMTDFLADADVDLAVPANDATLREPKTAENGMYAQPWR
jgi:hypothetical protein